MRKIIIKENCYVAVRQHEKIDAQRTNAMFMKYIGQHISIALWIQISLISEVIYPQRLQKSAL